MLTKGANTCQSCRRVGGPSRAIISTTYTGLARDLVRKYKFGHQRAAATSMAKMMGDVLLDNYRSIGVKYPNYLVVPVPTATSRVRQRGFDHSILLAKHLARQLNLNYSQTLGRLGQASQVGTGRADRLKQPAGQYFVRTPWQVRGQSILLIDDVITTGGTLLSATQELRRAGAIHVDALIFAKRL